MSAFRPALLRASNPTVVKLRNTVHTINNVHASKMYANRPVSSGFPCPSAW